MYGYLTYFTKQNNIHFYRRSSPSSDKLRQRRGPSGYKLGRGEGLQTLELGGGGGGGSLINLQCQIYLKLHRDINNKWTFMNIHKRKLLFPPSFVIDFDPYEYIVKYNTHFRQSLNSQKPLDWNHQRGTGEYFFFTFVLVGVNSLYLVSGLLNYFWSGPTRAKRSECF